MKKIICILMIAVILCCSSCTESEQKAIFPMTVYEDDICKIVVEDFFDPEGEPGYTFFLPVTVENKSNEAFIVAPKYYSTMNNEDVVIICIPESGKSEYGYEFVVMPNETITENFRVGYAQTSIRNINNVKTIKTGITLHKVDFSEEILNTGDLLIDLK